MDKKSLYLKKFFFGFLIAEIAIVIGSIFYLLTYGKNDLANTENSAIFASLLSVFFISLFYIHDPNPKNLISKEYFSKIGTRHLYAFVAFGLLAIAGYIFPLGMENIIPMPISGFYGHLVILFALIWCVIFNKQIRQIFDVITMYIKDELYLETWPALEREENRKISLQQRYKDWILSATVEERNYYASLKGKSEREARDYAASRMRQIEQK